MGQERASGNGAVKSSLRPLLLLLAWIAVVCPPGSSPAQDIPGGWVVVPADAGYTHKPSGMAFPPAVGDFRRASIRRYDEAGTDESVGYNFVATKGGMVATVYVYPTPADVAAADRADMTEREFDFRKGEIVYVHADARLVSEDDMALTQRAKTYRGRKAVYSFEHVFAGKLQPLRSELHLFGFVGGRWFVKYRFTYPVDLPATERIQRFMRALEITIAEAR